MFHQVRVILVFETSRSLLFNKGVVSLETILYLTNPTPFSTKLFLNDPDIQINTNIFITNFKYFSGKCVPVKPISSQHYRFIMMISIWRPLLLEWTGTINYPLNIIWAGHWVAPVTDRHRPLRRRFNWYHTIVFVYTQSLIFCLHCFGSSAFLFLR